MNKSLRITLIILLTLLAVILTVGFVYLLNGKGFSFLSFRFSGTESKELVIDQTFENIYESIDINTEAGNVYIKNTNDENIRVVVYGEKDNSNIESNSNILKITGNTKKCSFICINNIIARIEVYIPNNYDKKVKIINDVGDIKIEKFENLYTDISSDTGDINIDIIESADIKVHTGDIKINKINTANIKTTTGDIEIDEINEFVSSTTTGNIEINKINNYIDSSTTTGNIKIYNINLTKDSKINSNTGDITIKNISETYIDAHSSVGDININNNYRTAEFSLYIKTNTGDIKVKN